MRKSNGLSVLVCALCVATLAAPANGQSSISQSSKGQPREFRVYDVSDILPVEVRMVAPGGMTVKELEKLNTTRGSLPGYGNVERHRTEPVTIAMELASALDVDSVVLATGVIGVLADSAGQDAFASALDALHDAYNERAGVRIALYEVGPGAAVAIGAHANPDWDQPIRQIHQAIRRLVSTPMSSTATHRFVQNVTAISGTGGYGYQGQVADMTDGFDLAVRVGALSKEDGSLVDVQGELSRMSIRKTSEMKGFIGSPTGAVGEAYGTFELPTVDRRPIHSTVRVRDGEETIIAVMDDPDPDAKSWLVVTVKVSAVR